jgi:hypothetical protein
MAVTLARVGTALYAPAEPAAAKYARFLRWSTQSPPETLVLEDVWSQVGTPASVGYFAFVDGDVPAGFEEALRRLLPADAPTATGFAWVSIAGGAPALKDLAAVEAAEDGPRLRGEVPFALPPGVVRLTLAGGSRLAGTSSADGSLDGFIATYPPLAGAPPPQAPAIALPMTGGAVGALGFQGLMSAPGGGAAGVVKQLWNVQVDPLRPFDASRTYQAYTSRAYLLSVVDGVYRLTPLTPPA